MKSDEKKKCKTETSKNLLLKELDKGIDAMENGRTMPHDKAMRMICTYIKKIRCHF